jgi:DNA-directed RNA polymerase subunit K/omega
MPPKKTSTKKSTQTKKNRSKKEDKPVDTEDMPDEKFKAEPDLDDDDDIDIDDDFIINSNVRKEAASIYGMDFMETPEFEENNIISRRTIIPPELRKCNEVMSRANLTRLIEERAKQIENGHEYFCDAKNLSDPIDIAKQEIIQKKCPLTIVKKIYGGRMVELWPANEMIMPFGTSN